MRYACNILAMIVTLFMAVIFGTALSTDSILAKSPDASGLLVVGENDPSKEFYTNLDGEWHFFEKELLTPGEAKEKMSQGLGTIVTLPDSFKRQTGEVNTFGTYSATIRIPERVVGEALAIHIPFQYSAYSLFVDQVETAKNGVVGRDSASHFAEMAPKIVYFFAQSDGLLLTIQVSSFDHIRGGLENTIYIGEAAVVMQKFNTAMIGNLFINGCIFIVGLFMILLACYRRQEHIFFVFGVFCVFISLRALFAYPFYYTLTFLDMSWLWGTRLEYILTEASSWFYVILLWQWHKEEFSKKVMLGLSAVHIALIVITLFTQPVFFQDLFFKVFYLAVPTFFYLLYVIYKSIRNRNRTALVNIIGLGIIFLAFFNDFAVGKNWYQSWTLMLPAVGVYVMIHVVLMSKGFAQTLNKTEQLNKQLVALNTSLDDQVHQRTVQLQEANVQLKQLASMDSLTGIYNRHSLNEYLAQSFHEAAEQGMPLSLLMLDLDEFKKYNDHYGHIGGDALLQKVVALIGKQLPEGSFFARYGGEEFVVVLPNTDNEATYRIAERTRRAVEQAALEHAARECGIVTVSTGVSTMTKGAAFQTDVVLINAADQRLYQAKQAGGNRVM